MDDLRWLQDRRDAGAFVSISEYRRSVLGARAEEIPFDDAGAVTLEVSALQYFPWLMRRATCDRSGRDPACRGASSRCAR